MGIGAACHSVDFAIAILMLNGALDFGSEIVFRREVGRIGEGNHRMKGSDGPSGPVFDHRDWDYCIEVAIAKVTPMSRSG
jgi:hypothetical protein